MLLAPPNMCSTLISSTSSATSHNATGLNFSLLNSTSTVTAAHNSSQAPHHNRTLVKRYAPSSQAGSAQPLSSVRETPSSSRQRPIRSAGIGVAARRGTSAAGKRGVLASELRIPKVGTTRRSITKRQRKSINNLRRSLRLYQAGSKV